MLFSRDDNIVAWKLVVGVTLMCEQKGLSQDSDDYPQRDHNSILFLQILFISLEKATCSIEDEVGSGEGMGDVGYGGIGGAPKWKGEREGNRTGTKREEGRRV